jgi:antitoxin (DNA-binding transcriptional repressor) of toxin-antitoxin stability system
MTWPELIDRVAAGERLTVVTAEAGVEWYELVAALSNREWRELRAAANAGRQAMLAAQMPA